MILVLTIWSIVPIYHVMTEYNFLSTKWAYVVILKCTYLCLVIRNMLLPVHNDVIKWKHFQRYWPFVLGIHRSPVNSPHQGQWRGALMFSLICTWINARANNHGAGDLKRHRAHYDVILMDKATSVNALANQMLSVSVTLNWRHLMITIVCSADCFG